MVLASCNYRFRHEVWPNSLSRGMAKLAKLVHLRTAIEFEGRREFLILECD